MEKKIQISSGGLKNKKTYAAHAMGNWGPEQENSDHLQHPLTLSEDGLWLTCDGSFLEDHEEYKIVVPVKDGLEAKRIYGERRVQGKHVNTRFDFDTDHNTFWLLAQSHPVVRPGEWNQNNIYV
ncbi:hypothetical protein IID27_01280 [Patescibacteria group bacterium]|nr:hypothetical protein [Patescibacteria group bacterium]